MEKIIILLLAFLLSINSYSETDLDKISQYISCSSSQIRRDVFTLNQFYEGNETIKILDKKYESIVKIKQ